MANRFARSVPLFEKFVQTCFWLLFLPHSSRNSLNITNYSDITNTFYPDFHTYLKQYNDLLREIPTVVRLEQPQLGADALAALSAFNKLIVERDSQTNITPIFNFYRKLNGEDLTSNPIYSLILQILAAYSDRFEGDIHLFIPTSKDSDCTYIPAGCETVRRSNDPELTGPNVAPFWRWYIKLVRPAILQITEQDKQEQALQRLFQNLYFPFVPAHIDRTRIDLPLPNVLRLQAMLKTVLPPEGKNSEGAIKLYSAIQFVSFGMTDIEVIGDERYIPTDVSDFNAYLKTATSKEADLVSRYNITDFDRSQVAGSLEAFRLSELEAIKRGYVPQDDIDGELDDDAHDPDDDRNLDPDIDRIGDYTIGNSYSMEAADLDDDHSDDDAENFGDDNSDTSGQDDDSSSDTSGNEDSGDGSDGGNDSDGGNTDDPSGSGSDSPDGLGGDTNSTDPNSDPNGNQDDEKNKKVSSKNAISRQAYKSMWGKNPFKLANDNDPEGYFYRNNVSILNQRLQEDPGDAIPRSTKSTLNEWCKFWMHCSDVRYTVMLVKKLGLNKYLRV